MDGFVEGYLLRISIEESDKYEGMPLYHWLITRAHERQLASATALRGLMGLGADHRLHHTNVLRLSLDLPVVVEITDTLEKIEVFVNEITPAVSCGLITLERVRMKLCPNGNDSQDETHKIMFSDDGPPLT